MTSADTPTATADRRAALWACFAAGFATLFDAMTATYTAPALQHTLGAPTSAVQWFLASFSLTFGLGLVPGGRLGDAFGRRRLFVAGLVIFVVGGVLSATAPTVWIVIVGRFVQGLGAGILSAQVLGVIQDLFHGHERIRALGAYSASAGVAGLAGPLAAGILLMTVPHEFAWRFIVVAPLPFAAVAIILALRGVPPTRTIRARVTLDLPAIAMLGTLVVLIMLPVIEPRLDVSAQTVVFAGCGAILIALIAWERAYAKRGRLALFTPTLMRSRGFLAGNVVALLWFGAILAQGSVLTLYLLQVSGAPAIIVAIVFLPGAVGRIFSSFASQRVFARVGVWAVVGGLAAEVALGIVLAVWGPLLDLVAALVLIAAANLGLGVAGGLIEPTLRALTLAHATRELHGVAASFLQLTQRLAATYVVALATGILLGVGGVATPESLRYALFVCAGALGVALIVALDVSLRRAADTLRSVD